MNKKWLIPAIAGIALMASACGNNAAPNNTTPNKTTTQSTRHYTGTDGLHVRHFDGIGRGTTYGTHNTGTNYGPGMTSYGTRPHTYGTGYNGFNGMRNATGYGNYTGTGTYGTTGYTGTGTYGTTGHMGTGTYGTSGYTGTGTYGTTGHMGTGTYGTTGHMGTGTYGMRDGIRGFGIDGRHYDGFRNHSYNTTDGTRPYTAFPDGHHGTRTNSIYQYAGTHHTGMGTMSTTGATSRHMGYATTDRNHLQTTNVANQVYVDRDALARAVGNVTASCPGVQRSTVLVTDKEIFVGLNTNGQNVAEAKKQAKMNAMSVCPRYYKVFVTDNARDIQEITRVASNTKHTVGTRAADGNHVNALIKRMGGKTHTKSTGKAGTTSKTHGKKSHVGISSR